MAQSVHSEVFQSVAQPISHAVSQSVSHTVNQLQSPLVSQWPCNDPQIGFNPWDSTYRMAPKGIAPNMIAPTWDHKHAFSQLPSQLVAQSVSCAVSKLRGQSVAQSVSCKVRQLRSQSIMQSVSCTVS